MARSGDKKRRGRFGGRCIARRCPRLRKLAVHLRDGFRCVYCGTDLIESPPESVTVDHVDPLREDGMHEADNLVTACLACNNGRGDTPIESFATPEQLARVARQTAAPVGPYYVSILRFEEEREGAMNDDR